MSKEKNDIRLIQFSNYVHNEVKENTNKDWVMNGEKNSNYTYIIDRYKGSPTNAAICNAYGRMIYGKGLAIHDSEKVPSILDFIDDKDLKNLTMDKQIFNEYAIQVTRQAGGELESLTFIPKNKVIPQVADDDGNIGGYWYSRDWTKYNNWKTKYKPVFYPAFGLGENNEQEIYVGKPYTVGNEYFADPDYMSGLQYADLEEEISNFSISFIKNGLSLGTTITIPESASWDEKVKDKYVKAYQEKGKGSSNANITTVVFAQGTETTNYSSMDSSEAHNQWNAMREQSREQILTAHGCVAPSVVGISTSTGFSSTADEMDMGRDHLMKFVIPTKQEDLINGLLEISEYFGIGKGEDIYFRPLTEIEGEGEEEEEEGKEVEKDEDIKMAATCDCSKKKSSDLDDFIAMGEDVDSDEYDLIDDIEVDYEEEEVLQLASTGTARPNTKSNQDGEDYIVRYKYVGAKTGERDFCNKMLKANKVYRKEDIIQMGSKPVNPGFGMDGADTYSIWLYKGGGLLSKNFPGGTCKHKWNRVIYLKKGSSVDVNSPLAKTISTSQARRQGMKIKPNASIVSIAPHDVK